MSSMTEGLSVRVSICFKIAVISPLPISFSNSLIPSGATSPFQQGRHEKKKHPPPLTIRESRKPACDLSPFHREGVRREALLRRPKVRNLPSSNPWQPLFKKKSRRGNSRGGKIFCRFCFYMGRRWPYRLCQRCTLPLPSPPASASTSASETMLSSPSMLCFRQFAATANSIARCGSYPFTGAWISPPPGRCPPPLPRTPCRCSFIRIHSHIHRVANPLEALIRILSVLITISS